MRQAELHRAVLLVEANLVRKRVSSSDAQGEELKIFRSRVLQWRLMAVLYARTTQVPDLYSRINTSGVYTNLPYTQLRRIFNKRGLNIDFTASLEGEKVVQRLWFANQERCIRPLTEGQ